VCRYLVIVLELGSSNSCVRFFSSCCWRCISCGCFVPCLLCITVAKCVKRQA